MLAWRARMSGAAMLVGALVLVGWYADVALLRGWGVGTSTTKPATALALLALGTANLLRARGRPGVCRLCLGLAGYLATTGLIVIVTGRDLPVAHPLVGIGVEGAADPMSPVTAVSLLILVAATWCDARGLRALAVLTSGAALATSTVALLGYFYGVSALYTVPGFTTMALPTAVALHLLSLVQLLARPDRGLTGLLVAPGAAGRATRVMVPALVLGPPVIGWLHRAGERRAWWDSAFGDALLTLALTSVGLAVVLWSGNALRRAEGAQVATSRALAVANCRLENQVAQRTASLEATTADLQALVRSAPVAILRLAGDGGCLTINDVWTGMTGRDEATSTGEAWLDAVHRDDRDRVADLLEDVSGDHHGGTGYLPTTVRVVDLHGNTRIAQATAEALVVHGTRRGFILTLTDITARTVAEDRAAHMAVHDDLTGLPNRHLLVDRLHQALAQSRRVAVLFLDLDRFKDINDRLGHRAGDRLLVEVGERLRELCEGSGTVARLGGDEFVVVVPHLRADGDARAVAAAIRGALRTPVDIDGTAVLVDVSIGIAIGTGEEDPEELLRSADQAMYAAKDGGRGRHATYDQDLRARITRRLLVAEALPSAIAQGDVQPWFQPIVDLETGSVAAQEALARWSLDSVAVSPGEFIAVAEESGVIVDLGRHLMRAAVHRAAALPGGPAVSINLSARQFATGQLEQLVEDALEEFGLDPSRLWLELTESALVEAVDVAAATFKRLRRSGVRVAIDDFGTGFSSLVHLRSFEVDVLKVDMRFVQEVDVNQRDARIVSGVVGLATSLGIDVVAEGVETAAQHRVVRELGCRYGQGYWFARPDAAFHPALVTVPAPRQAGAQPGIASSRSGSAR